MTEIFIIIIVNYITTKNSYYYPLHVNLIEINIKANSNMPVVFINKSVLK